MPTITMPGETHAVAEPPQAHFPEPLADVAPAAARGSTLPHGVVPETPNSVLSQSVSPGSMPEDPQGHFVSREGIKGNTTGVVNLLNPYQMHEVSCSAPVETPRKKYNKTVVYALQRSLSIDKGARL